jgi:ABC-2 type transport system permease protein
VHASQGDLAGFLGWSALTLAAALAAFGVAVAVAHRLYRGELDVGEAPARAAHARIRLPGAMGALVEKDLRVAWRDPRLKAVTLSSVIGPLVLLFLLGQGSPEGVGPAQLVTVASIAGLGVVGSNALALERHGLGLLLGFPLDRLALLAAKNLAVLVLRGPALAALSLASLVLAGPLVAAAVATIVLLTQVVASAADNFLQILFPVPVAAAGGDPHAAVSGTRGLGAVATALLSMGATLAVAAPFAFLAWLPELLGSRALFALTLPLALGGACAVYFMAASLAARLLWRREPELLARLRGEE